MTDNAPKQGYNNFEFTRGAYRFTQEDGAWPVLEKARQRLSDAVQYCADCYPTISHHAELGGDEARELMIGAAGLEREFLEGPEYVVNQYLRSDSRRESMQQAIQKLVESFGEKSELSKSSLGAKLGIERESRQQALHRIPNEISLWVNINRNTIPDEKRTEILADVKHYNDTLHYVETYVDYAKGYLKQVNQQRSYGS